MRHIILFLAVLILLSVPFNAQEKPSPFPSERMKFGMFVARFGSEGRFTIEGKDWPSFAGAWRVVNGQLELAGAEGAGGCDRPALYRFEVDGNRVSFDAVADDCSRRKMVLDQSSWIPAEDTKPIATRRIVRTAAERAPALPAAVPTTGSWPSFRGTLASGIAEGQNLPDTWNVKTGENILWRTDIPALRIRVQSSGETRSS